LNDPADRTTLAWTRTLFAFLANGALLSIRDVHGSSGRRALLPGLLAAAVALTTYVIALRRQRTLQCDPLSERVTPRRQVYFVGAAVLALIVVTMVGQLV
jgi:uncharacterized membrane protein YidH (DUF202 family)